jgi:hypothetical protein
MCLRYTVKSGGMLQGKDKQEVALALYDLSLAPSSSFVGWMHDTANRIHLQFGYDIVLPDTYASHTIATAFVTQLEQYGLLIKMEN